MARVGEEFPPSARRVAATSAISPARWPPTDWGELVQVHDERDVFQGQIDELPAIDIHSLRPLPASYSSPVTVDIAGVPHVVKIKRYKSLLLKPKTGAIRWEFRYGALRALPALADGRLYVRNDDTLVCLRLGR